MAILDNDQFYNALDVIKNLIATASDLARTARAKGSPQAISRLADIQETYESLANAKMKLEQELVRLKAWEEEKSHYESAELAPGILADVKRPKAGTLRPDEWLCPKCFHKAKKSFFQLGKSKTHETRNCCECGLVIPVKPISFFGTTTSR